MFISSKNISVIYCIISIYVVMLIAGCTSEESGDAAEQDQNLQTEQSSVDSSSIEPEFEISDEMMYELIQAINTPLEMSSLIMQIGVPYSEDLLNSTDNSENYTTTYRKGVNLGIYGADLGYINMYNKTSAAVSYLGAIKNIADDLRIGQFFDFNTIKRLATNNESLVSLLHISMVGFQKMNDYLQEQKREKVSIYMLVGAWIEGLYLATQIVKKTPNEELKEAIGEQKIPLDDIKLLLGIYRKDRNFQRLTGYVNELKEVYDKVTITYTYSEPKTEVVNGVLMIEDNSTSLVNITNEQLEEITIIVEKIRKKLAG